MSQIEKALVTTLEASKIFGCHVCNAAGILRRLGIVPKAGFTTLGRSALMWPRAELERVAQIRAATRGQEYIPPVLAVDPFKGLVYTTREAAALLGVSTENVLHKFEKLGLVPVRNRKKTSYLWLKTDIKTIQKQIVADLHSSAAKALLPRVERAKQEFVKQYGCYPYQRPDLVSQWCEMLVDKAV